MKLVKQIDSTGCGLACVAMLSKTSYTKIKKTALKKRIVDIDYFGTSTNDLQILLGNKIKIGKKRILIKNKEKIPNYCILSVHAPKTPKNGWHWVIYKDGKIYDPGIGKIFNNFKRYKKKMHYVKIHKYI